METVVLYLRMSSDEQEFSIRQQREECLKYCRLKGYKVLREYVDEGLSGSKEPEKRLAFQQMLKDSNQQQFTVVICWSTSRFGRLDSVQGALPKAILSKNKVRLETTKGEVQDWNTMEGRLFGAIFAELDHLYSVNLGADVLRGKADALNNGSYPHGSTPYGYTRYYTNGTDTIEVTKNSKQRKPKNWRCLLKVNEEEKKVVQWIFEQFSIRDISFRSLAHELCLKNIAPPDNLAKASNGKWSYLTVGRILQDKIYIGTCHMGTGRQVGVAFQRSKPIEVPNFCEPIVDREVFDEVQRKIKFNKDNKKKVQPGNSSVISGLLYCGHCGYAMQKYKKGKNYFICSSPAKRPHLDCHQWRVEEQEMLAYICENLVQTVDRQLLQTLQTQDTQPTTLDTVEQQIEALRLKVKRAVERYLECPDEVKELALTHMQSLKAELQEGEKRLATMRTATAHLSTQEAAKWWLRHREGLVKVCNAHYQDKPRGVPLADGSILAPLDEQKHQETLSKICDEFFHTELDNEILDVAATALGVPVDEIKVHEPSEPSIWAQNDEFRAFLKKLGVKVRIWWEQVSFTPKRKRGESMFAVKETEFETALDWNSVGDDSASCSQRIPVVRAVVKHRHRA